MEGKTEIAYSSGLAFLHEEFNDSVILESLLEAFVSVETVKQIIIDVVDLHLFERVPVHRHGLFLRMCAAEIGQFGGNEVALTGMAAQRFSSRSFALTLKIYRCSVEIVDSVGDGMVYKVVDSLLIDDVLPILVLYHRPAHAAVSEQTYLVASDCICPACHFPSPENLTGGLALPAATCHSTQSAYYEGGTSGSLEKISSVYIVFHVFLSVLCFVRHDSIQVSSF